MADPMNPVMPDERPRPNTVTISSWLLYLVAALELIGAVIALAAMGSLADAYDEAYEGTDLAGNGDTIAAVGAVVGAVLGLLMAVGLTILAIFNNRGKNPSRITTWAVGGVLLCCSGFGIIGQLAGGAFNFGGGGSNAPDPKEVQEKVNDAVPWYTPTVVAISVLVLLALAGVLLLLALPPSNEFFRKRQPVWEPPVGYQVQPGYPAQPGQPAEPGYPPVAAPEPPPAGSSDAPPPEQPPGRPPA